jgi:hypothetical protein
VKISLSRRILFNKLEISAPHSSLLPTRRDRYFWKIIIAIHKRLHNPSIHPIQPDPCKLYQQTEVGVSEGLHDGDDDDMKHNIINPDPS